MNLVQDLAGFLRPRLTHLVDLQATEELQVGNFGRTDPQSDLKLVAQLSVAGAGALSENTMHRLLFEIASRRGWISDPQFDEAWLL